MPINNIHPSLEPLLVSIDSLVMLDNNPRKGNVDAIASSYEEFGQIKPIVVRPNDDGTATVIAGNHQLQAAMLLGWDKIAVVSYDVDDTRALAFAVADNRTMELGYTDVDLLNALILDVSDVYPELLEDLGWDKFDLAEVEQQSIKETNEVLTTPGQYTPPIINGLTGPNTYEDPEQNSSLENIDDIGHQALIDSPSILISRTADGGQHIELGKDISQNDVVTRGSTVVAPGLAPRAAVQYTLVFDGVDQQAIWYDFVKFLKTSTDYEGVTFSEKLISFIQENSQ